MPVLSPSAGRLAGAREVGSGALDEPARALAPRELAVPDDDVPTAEHDVRAALDLAALVDRVVDVHVVRLRGDRMPAIRVVDHDVGVATNGDRALLGIHP